MFKKILLGVLTTMLPGGAVVSARTAGTLTMSGSTSIQPLPRSWRLRIMPLIPAR